MRLGRLMVVVLSLVVAFEGSVGAAGPGTPSVGPTTRTPEAAASARLSKDVYGFFLPSEMDHMLQRADLGVLSTVAYFGLVARASGGLARRTGGKPDARWAAWRSPRMGRIIDRAHAAGVEVTLAVTRFAWDAKGRASTIKLLSSGPARARLVREVVAEIRSRGVDGVNVDFEPIPTGQSANFVKLVRALRRGLDALRPGLDLTVDATGFIANYDVHGLTRAGSADAILIMAYHYRGSWSTSAGSISPLRRNGYDVADTVAAFRREAPASKLILGLPYYGYIWSTTDGTVRAGTRSGSRAGLPASVIYRDAVALAALHGKRWDAQEQGPWVRWRTRACGSCPLTWRQLYYDDARSFGLKIDLAHTQGLRGIGIWTLGYEGGRTELNDVIRTKLATH